MARSRPLNLICNDLLHLKPPLSATARMHFCALCAYDEPSQVLGKFSGKEVAVAGLKAMKDVKTPAAEKLRTELKKRIGL